MYKTIIAAVFTALLFAAGIGNYQTKAKAQVDGVQSVYFEQERTGQLGFGYSAASLIECPDGSTQGGFILFNFRAFKSAIDDNVTGSWAAHIFEVFKSDEGALTELSVDENGFEAKGGMKGGLITSTTPGDEIAKGETTIMCEGTPIDEDTTVTMSGKCGQDVDVSFETSNGITGKFGGDMVCSAGDVSPVNVTVTSTEYGFDRPDPLTGMWIAIYSENGTEVASGFTPFSFAANSSTVYRVTAADYAGLRHSNFNVDQPVWEDEIDDNTRTIIPASDMTINAFYAPEAYLVKGFTELTNTANDVAPDLMVRAVLPDGNQTLHMWTIIQLSERPASTQSYRVYMHDYQDFVFDRWEDGNIDRIRDIAIDEDMTITAHYRTD